MKILIISNKPPYPPKDGGAIAIFNLAKGLAQNHHQVTIMAMNTIKHYVEQKKLKTIPNIQLKYIDINTHISFFKGLINFLFSNIPYTASRFKSKTFETELEKILNHETYDIIQIEGPYIGFYIPLIRRLSNAKIVVRAHNLEHEIWLRVANNEKNIAKKIYLKNLSKRIAGFEKRTLQLADAVLPITERDKLHLEKWDIQKPMLVTPVGIDVKITHATITHQRSIMFIGALDWAPNQEGILWFIKHIWPKVIKINPYMIFHVAGRNCPFWLQKQLISVRNLLFHGEIEQTNEFYEIGDIFIVPILSGSGMRVKIIEAMAYGKIVLTTTIGAEGINIENGKHMIIEDDPDQFAQKIIQILFNDALKKTIANEALQFVAHNYNNEIIANKVTKFYENILISQ